MITAPQPSSQAASDGSDSPSSKTTQGNMSLIRFMSDAMSKASFLNLSLAGASSRHSDGRLLRIVLRPANVLQRLVAEHIGIALSRFG
jgi:hypothetical protein